MRLSSERLGGSGAAGRGGSFLVTNNGCNGLAAAEDGSVPRNTEQVAASHRSSALTCADDGASLLSEQKYTAGSGRFMWHLSRGQNSFEAENQIPLKRSI